ncbi:hypothetical protein C0Q70_13717 [Pomacea canaliculata]|uniref:Uncharacterized protein n=1 Tax=Pomacea canaliculata TaxID=400727 RepID=A0A2T7NY08_POMCA|nr:hypothetical protein C0Q70_13717 [Pomacea canaliculata]
MREVWGTAEEEKIQYTESHIGWLGSRILQTSETGLLTTRGGIQQGIKNPYWCQRIAIVSVSLLVCS